MSSRTDLFSDTMLVRHDVYKVGIHGSLDPLTGQRVTTNYHAMLGVQALLGRMFTAADRPEAGAPPVAVISYALWQRRFAGSADVIGTSITVDKQPYTIVGVTPPEFRGILVGWTMDVTLPLDTSEFMQPGNWSTTPLIARLKPGVDAQLAQHQLDPMLAAVRRDEQDNRTIPGAVPAARVRHIGSHRESPTSARSSLLHFGCSWLQSAC